MLNLEHEVWKSYDGNTVSSNSFREHHKSPSPYDTGLAARRKPQKRIVRIPPSTPYDTTGTRYREEIVPGPLRSPNSKPYDANGLPRVDPRE